MQVFFIITILVYCMTSLIQDIAAIDLHIDEFFVTDVPDRAIGNLHPGRVAPSTKVCLIILSMTLLAMRNVAYKLVCQIMTVIVALISLTAVVGYLSHAPRYYRLGLFASMSMPTALLLFMNAINILLLHPTAGLLKFASLNRFGNTLFIKVFPRLLIAVLLLSALRLTMSKEGIMTEEESSALFALSFIVIGFLIILSSAHELNHMDDRRSQAEDALQKANENLELTIKERTKKLEEREQLLESIFDNTDASILVKGLDGKYSMGNKAFHQTFQIPKEGLTTKTVRDLSPKTLLDRQLSADQEVIKTGLSMVYEVKAPTPQGERHFRTNKFPIFDDHHNVTGIATVSTDITDLKKEKEDQELLATVFQEQNKQLVNFSHIITHNLRSPVVNLKTFMKFYHESNDPVRKATLLHQISSVIESLSITFEELMEIMKIREDISKERQLLSFEEVFNKTKATLSGQIEEAEVTLTHSFSVSTIHYPKVYLDSIFLNLMSNGIKYRSPQRKAHLHFITRLENNTIILEVIDNGLGLDMGKYGTLLFNLNKTFHNNPDARGVGLYITKTQVEAMGGTIEAESAVDVGTTFKITFK